MHLGPVKLSSAQLNEFQLQLLVHINEKVGGNVNVL